MVESQENLEFFVYNRSGAILFHIDLVEEQILYPLSQDKKDMSNALTDKEKEQEAEANKQILAKQKLVFGLIWSLKSFSNAVSISIWANVILDFSYDLDFYI